MRISFDLDEVLFVDPYTFRTEKAPPFPLNRVFPERLREGTIRLIHTLQDEGFEVWVYTSSFPAGPVHPVPVPLLRNPF